MSIKRFRDVDLIFDDLKELLSIKKDVELASVLGIEPGKLGVWRTRNFVPVELIIALCRDKGFDIYNVLYGDPKKEIGTRGATLNLDILRDVLVTVEEIFEKNDLYLSPQKKSQLILLLYEELVDGETKFDSINGRILKLVKLAS